MRELIKVTPDYSVTYYSDTGRDYSTLSRPTQNKVKGELTRKSRSRLRLALSFMVYISEMKRIQSNKHKAPVNYKLTFVTLTLSSTQIHSDHYLKHKLLAPFLRVAKSKWKVENYVWKAEVQDNGNLHFHILTDRFIPWRELRDVWNSIQEVSGYVSRSGIEDPNSTDIHAIYKAKNTLQYLTSYVMKKDERKKKNKPNDNPSHYYYQLNGITACDLKSKEEVGIKRPIEGKLFDCSKKLKEINCRWEVIPEIQEELDQLRLKGKLSRDEGIFKVYSFKPNGKEQPFIKTILDEFAN